MTLVELGLRAVLVLTGGNAQSHAHNCITLGVFQHVAAVYNRAGDRHSSFVRQWYGGR